MGERSKKIGEIGENIVENFFSLIGWETAIPNQSLKCRKPQKHARSGTKGNRETHGIDFSFCYKSPLESSTIETIIISVKHTGEPYEASPKYTFKKHVEDLVYTLECYKNSELKRSQIVSFGRVIKTKDTGVLFWISSNSNTYDDVVSKVSNTRLDPDWIFESFHIVDNKRIQFIYETIKFLHTLSDRENINFYYPETALSYVDSTISRFGKICPVEFLTSPILPLIIKPSNTTEQDTFCLSSIDPFDYDGLKRLIRAAREYTQDISCRYLLVFPNYIALEHLEAVKSAFIGLDSSFTSRIKIQSYRPDFRSLDK